MSELIKVTINGQEFEVEKGARLIDVCREKGFGIPSFCYYGDLALQASCRMCLVRIEKMPKLQTSCTITCTDGMIVTTQSEEIEKAQRAMGEFLLANHPLDCPVCDRGGECELQEMVFDWGDFEERFTSSAKTRSRKNSSRRLSPTTRSAAFCANAARAFATNGWAKKPSKPEIAASIRSSEHTAAGSAVRSAETASKFARPERF
jgi:NADH dehydrogenase/NADH:ubiquinone oxidoreductase subunit G